MTAGADEMVVEPTGAEASATEAEEPDPLVEALEAADEVAVMAPAAAIDAYLRVLQARHAAPATCAQRALTPARADFGPHRRGGDAHEGRGDLPPRASVRVRVREHMHARVSASVGF